LKKIYKDVNYELIYKILVLSLKISYEALYKNYQEIHSKCILEKQKKVFKKYLVKNKINNKKLNIYKSLF
jgi:hypothetical protein